MYAAITKARIEETALDLEAAYARLVSMVQSRLHWYGRSWEQWVWDNSRTRNKHYVPEKHQDKTILKQRGNGVYSMHEYLNSEVLRTSGAKGARDLEGWTVDTHQSPAEVTLPTADVEEDEEEDHMEGEEDHGDYGGDEEEEILDPDRDMSGDALTTQQAISQGEHAQCSLAAARNVRRNPLYTRERLSQLSIQPEYDGDIRLPDWPRILTEVSVEGECIKRGTWRTVPPHLLSEAKYAVTIQHRPHMSFTHVVALIWDDRGYFKLYDNDSPERLQGTYSTLTTQQLVDSWGQDTFFAVMEEDCELSRRLGPAITTMVHRARRSRMGWGEILDQSRPTQMRRER